MVLRKRLSALIIASVMVLTLSLPVFADEISCVYTDEYIMENFGMTKQEYNEFVLNRWAMPLTMGDSNTRNVTFFSNKGDGYVVFSYTDDSNVPAESYGGSTSSTLSDFRINLYNLGVTQYYSLQVDSGAVIDIETPVDYAYSAYSGVNVSGEFIAYLCIEGVSGGSTAQTNPSRVCLLVNGEEATEYYQMSDRRVVLDTEAFFTEDVNSIGYRLVYDTVSTGSGSLSSVGDIQLRIAIDEVETIWTLNEQPEDPNTGLLAGILDWIIGIYNSVFVPDSQKDEADAFQSEVSGTVTEADNVKTELDELEKPNPEDIDTDLSDIITDDAYTQQTQIFADLLRFDKITDMLMIVFTMALISYVLFGKKG